MLPRTAVMDKKTLNAERYANSSRIPLAQVNEHRICFPPPVKFIILQRGNLMTRQKATEIK